ncbi:MAG: hypothetical protein ACRDLK_00195 [Gaiellaceae bacterium]
MNSTLNHTVARLALLQPDRCGCSDPIPVERAERKGAAVVVCQRCGLRMPLRLRR